MGVEQWVYQKLGRPQLSIVGEVVSTLEDVPIWINVAPRTLAGTSSQRTIENVRLRGGCELEVMKHFFSFQSRSVDADFVFPRNGQVIWKSHSVTVFPQAVLETTDGLDAVRKVGFTKGDLTSNFFKDIEERSCLILSNSANSQVSLFKHRKLDLVVPVKLFGLDANSFDEGQLAQYCFDNRMSAQQAGDFRTAMLSLREEFVPLAFDQFNFPELYRRIATAVPLHSLLIFLLPLTYANNPDGGITEYDQQKVVNEWLRDLSTRHDNVRVVDTADCVTSLTELKKFSHLHFSRDVYFRIYNRLVECYESWSGGVAP